MSIIIAGGSITGISLALSISILNKNKIKIFLIEKKLINKKNISSDPRTIALAYNTCQQYKKIGIWKELKKYATPIKTLNVSKNKNINLININAKNFSIPVLGYTIKLQDLKKFLFQKIKNFSNIFLFHPEKIISIKKSINNISVKLKSGKCITGKLLIAADGTFSSIRKIEKIEFKKKIYKQFAIIFNILTSKKLKGNAIEYFNKNESIAILPILNGYNSIIWCKQTKTKKKILKWTKNKYKIELEKIFHLKIGKIIKISKFYFFPIIFLKSKKIISYRLILIGNSAQTLHPIAAQGFNLIMRDIIVLSHIISKKYRKNQDIGSYSFLFEYKEKRNFDREQTIKFTNNLIKFYMKKNFLFNIIHNLILKFFKKKSILFKLLIYKKINHFFSLKIFEKN